MTLCEYFLSNEGIVHFDGYGSDMWVSAWGSLKPVQARFRPGSGHIAGLEQVHLPTYRLLN
jgi:hypothetical protein